MKRYLIILLAIISMSATAQSWEMFYKVRTRTEPFRVAIARDKVVYCIADSALYSIDTTAKATDSLATIIRWGKYTIVGGGSGGTGDSYWQELTGNLANIDTTTGFYVNSTSGVKNVNLSMYPASSWWRVEQTNRTTGVQSVAQGSAGVVSLQANAGGATDVVQVNGAGYLYGRTGSNGMNLGSSTYRWGLLYSDSINTKTIYANGRAYGVGVYGQSEYSNGIKGLSDKSSGVLGLTATGTAVQGTATGAGKAGSFTATGGGDGIYISAPTGAYAASIFGNVGIGKTNPSTALDVTGVITATGGTSTDWNSAAGWVTTNGGNVANWNTAYGWGNHAGLYIPLPEGGITQGDIWYGGDTQTQTISKPTGEDNYTLKWMGGSGGTPSWQTEEWTKTGTYTVRQNRVGIGVASPLYWLHVGGAVKSDTALTPLALGGSAVSSSLTLKSTSATGSSDYIAFVTGSGTEAGRFTTNGRLGIGTTAPVYTLDINGDMAVNNIYKTVSSLGISAEDNMLFSIDYNNNDNDNRYYAWFKNSTGGTELMRLTEPGNLGIGTTTPTAQVHLTKDLKIGTTKDSITIDTTNGLRLWGNTVVYDDIVFGFSTGVNGVAAYPAFNADSMYWNFTVDTTSPSLCKKYYTIQIPHRTKEGNITIYPHVHYRHTTTGGTPTFIVKYRWYNIGEKPGAFTWRRLTSTTGTDDGTHQMNYSTLGITKSNSTLSSILDMQIYLYSQTGTGGINAMQFDLHIPIDKLGSDNEYTNN